MKGSAFVALATLGVMLSGCATVFQGTTEKLHVATVPDTQADCVLQNHEGRWRTRAPGTVKVKRSSSALHVECDAPGYGPGYATAEAHFNGVTFGNVVAGGLIGVGVDAATGANESYDDVTIPLGPPLADTDSGAVAGPGDWRALPPAPPRPVEDVPTSQVARHQAPAWQPVPPDESPDDTARSDPPAPAGDDEPPPWGAEPQ